MSEYFIFIKRIGLVGVANLVMTLKGLVVLALLTKFLGAADFGIWTQIILAVSFLQPFVQLALPHGLLRFVSGRGKGEIVQGFITIESIIIPAALIVIAIFLILSGFVAHVFLKDDSAASIIRMAAPLLLLDAVNGSLLSSFRLFEQIKRFALVLTTKSLLEAIFIAIAVILGYGLEGAVVALIIGGVISLSITLALILSYAGFARPNYSTIRALLGYSLPLIPTLIFQFVISGSDRYVIGNFLGASPVGIYSAAYSIGSVLLTATSYVIYVLRPLIYGGYDQDKIARVQGYLSQSFKYLMMLCVPAVVGVSLMARPLLALLTTSEFTSTGTAVIPLISVGMLILSAELFFESIFFINKNTLVVVLIYGVCAAVNLGLNILLVPAWGIVGSAAATIVAYSILAVIMFFRSRLYLKFDLNPGFLGKCLIASAPMGVAVWLLNPSGVLGIVLAIVLGIVVYFAMLYILKAVSLKEVGFFRDMLARDRAN